MLSNNKDSLIKDIYQKYQNIITICLLKQDGNFSAFFTKKNIDEGEKKRLAASIMASVVLAERSIINLVQEHVKHVIIKAENNITIILITNLDNYLYILADIDFDYKNIITMKLDF